MFNTSNVKRARSGKRLVRLFRPIPALLLAVIIGGCATPAGNGNDNNANDNGNSASATYDPSAALTLQSEGVTLEIPPFATVAPATLTVREAAAADLPAPLPGGVGLAGGVFAPDGQTFLLPGIVTVQLNSATIAPQLPVVTYHDASNSWVGTGATATVSANGTQAEFELEHFSIAGVPDPVPIPDPGDEIGSFVVVSNNGTFSSDAISSDSAALLYSEFGDTFNISATSQSINMQGLIETKALGLDAILVTRVENYVVGVVGGGASLFNDGQFNEPLVGVMIMAVNGSTVNLSVYVATPERVISGSLNGPV